MAVWPWEWWTVRNKLNADVRDKPADEACALIQKHLAEFLVEKPRQLIEALPKLILMQHIVKARHGDSERENYSAYGVL
jgi:hypothetical protein